MPCFRGPSSSQRLHFWGGTIPVSALASAEPKQVPAFSSVLGLFRTTLPALRDSLSKCLGFCGGV
eukprot:6455779-Amphidinium_carterae.1